MNRVVRVNCPPMTPEQEKILPRFVAAKEYLERGSGEFHEEGALLSLDQPLQEVAVEASLSYLCERVFATNCLVVEVREETVSRWWRCIRRWVDARLEVIVWQNDHYRSVSDVEVTRSGGRQSYEIFYRTRT